MQMLRIGILALFAMLSFAVTFALKRNAASDLQARTAHSAVAVNPVNAAALPALPELRRQAPTSMAAMTGIPDAPDTTGLLQQSIGIDELLDIVNADAADGFTPVDRGRFTAQLKADPALRDALLRDAPGD